MDAKTLAREIVAAQREAAEEAAKLAQPQTLQAAIADLKMDNFGAMDPTALHALAVAGGAGIHPAVSKLIALGNPFSRVAGRWNITAQVEIRRSWPSLAERLRSLAGGA